MEKINIFIVDDHSMIREGLKQLLELENDIQVIGEAGNGEECLKLLETIKPDVILLDINMPIMNGLKMLEVLDNFERGEKALENVEDCQKVKDSFNLVHKQVTEVLQNLGLEEIDAQGKEFDPNFHDAVMKTPTEEHAEDTVITVLQKGYKVGEKVLRPALVNVATAE